MWKKSVIETRRKSHSFFTEVAVLVRIPCVIGACALCTFVVPPDAFYSGPMFLLTKFDGPYDRLAVRLFAGCILLLILGPLVSARVGTYVLAILGLATWIYIGLVVRFSIEW